jgi:hypothetical protein
MNGDTNTDSINLVIPANIRFKHYQSAEALKLENKFAVVPLKIPVVEGVKKALLAIPSATKKLRTAFGEVYTTYFLTKLCTKFLPYFFN